MKYLRKSIFSSALIWLWHIKAIICTAFFSHQVIPGTAEFCNHINEQSTKTYVLLVWQGARGLGRHVDHIYNMTKYGVQELVRRHDRFQLWNQRFETPALLFQYVPFKLRALDRQSEDFQCVINRVSHFFNFSMKNRH